MLPDHNVMTANILSVYQRSTDHDRDDGAAWYQSAHTFATGLSERYDVSLRQACGIIAALSPRVSWEMNLRLAETIASGGRTRGLKVTVGKAERILAGEDPATVFAAPKDRPTSGQKVRAFFANILSPTGTDQVTIDRHAYDIALGAVGNDLTRDALDRVGVYDAIAAAYRDVAFMLNVMPSTLQATTWLTWRREKREQ